MGKLSKILKFVTKRKSKFKGFKKFIRKDDIETTISYKSKESISINMPKTFASISFGSFGMGRAFGSSTIRKIKNVRVHKSMEGKGLGKDLTFQAMKRMKGKNVKGEVISKGQVSIRNSFEGNQFFNPKTKSRKPVSKDFAELLTMMDGHVNAKLIVPRSGIKKHINKSTGKVRFIRRRGRIIPIRGKKK